MAARKPCGEFYDSNQNEPLTWVFHIHGYCIVSYFLNDNLCILVINHQEITFILVFPGISPIFPVSVKISKMVMVVFTGKYQYIPAGISRPGIYRPTLDIHHTLVVCLEYPFDMTSLPWSKLRGKNNIDQFSLPKSNYKCAHALIFKLNPSIIRFWESFCGDLHIYISWSEIILAFLGSKYDYIMFFIHVHIS